MKKKKSGNSIKGTLQKHKRGFGFVIPSEGRDIFISGNDMNGAMNGDLVQAELLPRHLWKNSPEGVITGILQRSVSEVVGTFEKSKKFGFVVPDDRKINEDVFIRKRDFGNAEKGDKVAVKIIRYPDRGSSAEGRIVQVISKSGQPGGDIKSLIRQYGLSSDFPARAGSEAEAIYKAGIKAEDRKYRKDLTEKDIMTIDGPDSKDFDDAVCVDLLPGGNYLLGVHIADVSHYVKEDSALDREALKRGNSVYLIDQVVPMLPEALSNGICSLNPGEERLALSVDMEIDHAGQVVDHKIYESIVRSKARMVYTDVSDMLEKGDERLIDKYRDIYDQIAMMEELALILRKRREERGSLDFDLDETNITLDQEGIPVNIGIAERREANKLIEEFMLLANQTVAEDFSRRGIPFIYRVHERPARDKMLEFSTFIKGFGISMNTAPEDTDPLVLAAILEKVKGQTYENIVNTVMLRSMQKADYQTECRGHFGLALKYYTHFTSPIRRYPDLMIHRIIKSWLHGETGNADLSAGDRSRWKSVSKRTKLFARKTKEAADISSATERQAVELEREVEKMKKAEYMSYHIGEEFRGIISGVTNFGIYVELENTVEGMIRLDSLKDDYYDYQPEKYRIMGRRTKKIYSLGDEAVIKVLSVNIEDREIDFMLLVP